MSRTSGGGMSGWRGLGRGKVGKQVCEEIIGQGNQIE